MRVGFAGLGRMGVAMARNVAAAGHELTVWNRTAAKAEALAAETGAAVAPTPKALADASDIVITMLADDPSSHAVHLGGDGLFSGQAPMICLEMGTMSPDHIRALAEGAPAGMTVIDAPVSGATPVAEKGELMIMAGCSEATMEPLMPVLEAMGRHVICLGSTGAGSVMKLAINSLIHGINQTLAEAMTLAEAAGIPPRSAFDAIEASAACAPMISYRRPLYLDEAAHEVTFTVALARKDMEVTAALAEAQGTGMPQGRVTLEKLKAAEACGYGARDMASMLDFMREGER